MLSAVARTGGPFRVEEPVSNTNVPLAVDPALEQGKLDLKAVGGAGRRRLGELSGLLAAGARAASGKKDAGFNSAL